MRRSPMRRSGFGNSRRRELVERPGVTPAMPKDWKARCRKVRIRDRGLCRRCGTPVTGAQGAIDHIIPRRIASERRMHALSNLVLLCTFNGDASCHSMKTHVIEPALYRGDVQPFERFLTIIGDPTPTSHTLARAYLRIRSLQHAEDQEAQEGSGSR